MASLQDQLLKAGLTSQKKVKQVNQEKTRQKKVERRTGVETPDEVRLAVLEKQRKDAERARELNAQRDALAREKAVMAQIAQMIQQSREGKGGGDIAYNFTYDGKVKRLFVSEAVRAHLVAGRLLIVAHDEGFELVPRVVGEKIAEHAPSLVIRVGQSSAAVDADDPYADYKIPDDFTW